MPAGELTVEARAAGNAPARTTTTLNAVTVTPGTAVALTGRVTAGATPVAGAVLTTGESFAVTGADGRYSLPRLAAGPHDVWVLATGFAPQVKRGAIGTADFAVITTRRDADGLDDAKRLGTIIRAVDAATGVTVASAVTGQGAASAQLGPLPAGTYSVRGRRRGRPVHDARRRRCQGRPERGAERHHHARRGRLPGLHGGPAGRGGVRRPLEPAQAAGAQPQGRAGVGPRPEGLRASVPGRRPPLRPAAGTEEAQADRVPAAGRRPTRRSRRRAPPTSTCTWPSPRCSRPTRMPPGS